MLLRGCVLKNYNRCDNRKRLAIIELAGILRKNESAKPLPDNSGPGHGQPGFSGRFRVALSGGRLNGVILKWAGPLAAVVTLALLVGVLHGDALSLSFGRDDGAHLFNATRLSPLSFLLHPATSVWVSGASVAPWNLLVYWINVSLFGLDAGLHHLHLLAVVLATAVATWLFLRTWLPAVFALLGAALHVAGAPTMYLAHEEMSGHYAYGLLFCILAMHLLVRYWRGGSRWLVVASVVFYLLALACKEVYVPMPVVFLFLPQAKLRKRLAALTPHFLLLAGYAVWRWLAFGGSFFGPKGMTAGADVVAVQFAGLPALLFGMVWPLALAVLGAAAVASRRRLAGIVFVAVAAGAMLAPLIPLSAYPGVLAPDRYLYLIWWALSCALAVAVSSLQGLPMPARVGLMLALVASQIVTSLPWRADMAQQKRVWAAWYGFILDPAQDGRDLLLPDDNHYFWQKWNIDGMRLAARNLGLPHNRSAQAINTGQALQDRGVADPAKFVVLDPAMSLLRPVRDTAELAAIQGRLVEPPSATLAVRVLPRMGFAVTGSSSVKAGPGQSILVRGTTQLVGPGQIFTVIAPASCRVAAPPRHDRLPAGRGAGSEYHVALECGGGSATGPGGIRPLCLLTSIDGEYSLLRDPDHDECLTLTQR